MIIWFLIYYIIHSIINMSFDDEIWIEDENEICKIERLNEA